MKEIRITSRQNEHIKQLRLIKEGKNDDNLTLVSGLNSIRMAHQSGLLKEIICLEKMEEFSDVTNTLVSEDIIKLLSVHVSPSGAIGVVALDEPECPLNDENIVLLDNVQDPGNVGTIYRNALAFSFKHVYSFGDTAKWTNSKVIQASEGALFHLDFRKVDISYLKNLKKIGYKIIVTTLGKDSIDLESATKLINSKFVIVFSNEGHGVNGNIDALADLRIKINIKNIDSLNVASASAITLFCLDKLNS